MNDGGLLRRRRWRLGRRRRRRGGSLRRSGPRRRSPSEDDQPAEEELADEEADDQGDAEQDGYEAAGGGGGGGRMAWTAVMTTSTRNSRSRRSGRVDEDVARSADDFPNADPDDFEDDDGSWTPDDYQESAQNLFGRSRILRRYRERPNFRSWVTKPSMTSACSTALIQVAPGASESLKALRAKRAASRVSGSCPRLLLQLLMARYGRNRFQQRRRVGFHRAASPLRRSRCRPHSESIQAARRGGLAQVVPPRRRTRVRLRAARAFAWTHATRAGE
jgi:hypothetical protein